MVINYEDALYQVYAPYLFYLSIGLLRKLLDQDLLQARWLPHAQPVVSMTVGCNCLIICLRN